MNRMGHEWGRVCKALGENHAGKGHPYAVRHGDAIGHKCLLALVPPPRHRFLWQSWDEVRADLPRLTFSKWKFAVSVDKPDVVGWRGLTEGVVDELIFHGLVEQTQKGGGWVHTLTESGWEVVAHARS